VDISPESISLIMIAEAAPPYQADYFYASGDPLFLRTTLLAFNDAGIPVSSARDILDLGVYLTTAIKCSKTGYSILPGTIRQCSVLLEQELALFAGVKAYLLMGDVAIRAVNDIARRAGEARAIPAGPTYKLRGGEYSFHGKRAFPSYLQAGPSFFIEKSKRRMIAEDIAAAFQWIKPGVRNSQSIP
jgi:uracil-DNA glycosylase